MSVFGKAGRRGRGRDRSRTTRPIVELFEERTLLSTFTVTDASDNGDNTNPTVNTLRWAVQQAELPANAGSTIDFDLTTGSSPFVINLNTTALLPISQPTTIDGTSQPGYTNAPIIVVNGSALGSGSGLDLTANGSTILGLDIVGFTGAGAAGINVASSNNVIQSNYIGVGPNGTTAGPGNAAGLLISGSNNAIGGTTAAERNSIGFNTQSGVAVLSGSKNAIRENQYFGTNGPLTPVQTNDIDVSPTANNGLLPPTLQSAEPAGTSLTMTFTVNASGPVTLDVYRVNSAAPGQRQFLGTADSTGPGPASFTLTGVSVNVGDSFVATATTANDGTSAFSAAVAATNPLVVSNLNDSGPGSLRDAMNFALSHPGSVIAFVIPGAPPAPSPFVINVTSAALPTMNVPVTIDATTEPGYNGTPLVEINGGGLGFNGLTLASGSTGSRISGLAIVNFATGIVVQSDGDAITGNQIGTDSAGANLQNQAGIAIGSSNNTIGGTTASLGNTIAFNKGDAIDVTSGSGNSFRQNLIYGNGGNIVLASPIQAAPTVIAVASVPYLTTIDYTVTGTVGQSYSVEFFASSALGSPAAQFLATVTTPALTSSTQSFTATLNFPAALASGQTVTATVTAPSKDTSELAASVGLSLPFQVTNTSDNVPGSTVGSLRLAILDANNSPPTSGNTDPITFNITTGTAPFVISPAAVLPTVGVPVTIDGTSQSGFSGTPVIVINGGGRAFDGLTLGSGVDPTTNQPTSSSKSVVKGIEIIAFGGNGLVLQSSNNTIGGVSAGNVLGGNGGAGLLIGGLGSDLVQGNYIGTDSTGTTTLPNAFDIQVIQSANNTIGGTATGEGNTIGYYTNAGIAVLSGNGNIVTGNTYLNTVSGTSGPTATPATDIVLTPGANKSQPAPVLLGTTITSSSLTLSFTLAAPSSGTATLDIYAIDPTTGAREYLGTSQSVALPNGLLTATIPLPGPGNLTPATDANILATASTATNGTPNGTSAFSTSINVNPYVVTNNLDTSITVGTTTEPVPGSLRAVIAYANATPPNAINNPLHPGAITFNISGNSLVISLTSKQELDITAAYEVDGSTQPGVTVAGDGTATASGTFDGFVLKGSGGIRINGMEIIGLRNGIVVPSSGDLITNNLIGTDGNSSHTTTAFGNVVGILVDGANGGKSVTVGGASAGANTIGFNTSAGVSISGASGGNSILGNYIGTDAAGSNLGNAIGVSVSTSGSGFVSNTIGGTTGGTINSASLGGVNIIGWNSVAGVSLGGMSTIGTLVRGNYIGVDPFNPTQILPRNLVGIAVSSPNNTIGGTVLGSANIIGNSKGSTNSAGISITGNAATGNLVQGNDIGTDLNQNPVGNNVGILIDGGASKNWIGGDSLSGAYNVVGSNTIGISIASAQGNLIQGDFIGTDPSGHRLGNKTAGIQISGSSNTIGPVPAVVTVGGAVTIGSTAATAGNIISANGGDGIDLNSAQNNKIQGNTIGAATSAGGPTFFGNQGNGIGLTDSASNTIGGPLQAGTVTIGGKSYGVMQPNLSVGNLVLGNASDGILISVSNTASAASTIEGNLISQNALNGIHVQGDLTGDQPLPTITDNFIGTDATGTTVYDRNGNRIGNGKSGIFLEAAAATPPATKNSVVAISGNLISGNGLSGVTVAQEPSGGPYTSVDITGNILGLDVTGQTADVYISGSGAILPLGNVLDGVLIDDVVGVTVGSPNALDSQGRIQTLNGNVISGNLGRGIEVRGNPLPNTATVGNVIEGNVIGLNRSGLNAVSVPANAPSGFALTFTLGNLSDGLFLLIPGNVTIGGTVTASQSAGNVISNNRAAGIHAATQANAGTSTGALTIQGNRIGTDVTGQSITDATYPNVSLGNGSDGVFIDLITGNVTIGGTAAGGASVANVISGNRANGIDLLGSSGVVIGGNDIGTDAVGLHGLGNSANGIFLNGSSGVSIGVIPPATAGGSSVPAGNLISGNLYNGILLANNANNNTISFNLIGTDGSGTLQLGNSADGIFLLGGVATIGGTVSSGLPTEDNLISGNTVSGNNEDGIQIFGPGARDNAVSDNSIGIGSDGSTRVANGANGVYLNEDAGGNKIGQVGSGNAISGNGQSGVLIFGTLGDGGSDVVQGNRIGTDSTGMSPVRNGGNGVFIYGTANNSVSGNTISGNAQAGVALFSPAGSLSDPSHSPLARNNSIYGNSIGVGADGKTPVPNLSDGVDLFSAPNNTIGQIGSPNVISGNAGNGVLIAQLSDVPSTGNVLFGNYIGTDSTGMKAVGNVLNGVLVNNDYTSGVATALGNSIGLPSGSVFVEPDGTTKAANAPASPSNVISGNGQAGVQFIGDSPDNSLEGNYIGVNSSGGAGSGLGNGLAGVLINFVNNFNNADRRGQALSGETIGSGTTLGAGNIISGSAGGLGVEILGTQSTSGNNLIQGNLIGVDLNDAVDSNNVGISIQGASGNLIGGPGLMARNVISANSQGGVELSGLTAIQNTIQGNAIGTDLTGTQRPGGVPALSTADPVQFYGVQITTPSPALAAGVPNNVILQNLISGNMIGINITGVGSAAGKGQGVPLGQDLIQGNRIGTDASGYRADPNFEYGIYIDNSAANTVGGSSPGSGNVLSANGIDGVEIFGGTAQASSTSSKTVAAADGNVIEGNLIGVDVSGNPSLTSSSVPPFRVQDGPTITLGEQLYGVVVIGSSSNIIGARGVGNTIGGNVQAGVYITRLDFHGNLYAVPTNNTLNSNMIMNNGVYGVYRYESPQNSVAMGRQRFHNTFRGNYINLADYISTLNANTQLPRLRSRYSHRPRQKTGKVAHPHRHPGHAKPGLVAHAAQHEVYAVALPHARVETVSRPTVPALFLPGVKTRVIEHVPSHRHR